MTTIQAQPGQHARSSASSQGRRAKPRPAWPALAAAGAAIVAAGLLIGFLVTRAAHASRTPARGGGPAAAGRHAAAPVPSGYRLLSVPGSITGATAGFGIAVPRSWRSHQAGLVTTIRPPAGPPTLTVSLAPFAAAGARAEAQLLLRRALLAGAVRGYRTGALQSLQVAGAPAAGWTASWARPTSGRLIAREVVFTVPTGAGDQPYSLRVSAPMAGWPAAQAVLATVLGTFRVVP